MAYIITQAGEYKMNTAGPIVGDLITREKYRFVDSRIIAEVVADTMAALDEWWKRPSHCREKRYGKTMENKSAYYR